MRRVFADAVYWIALANRKDQWHGHVVRALQTLGPAMVITTEEVLDEYLTHYSSHGPALRNLAATTVDKAFLNPDVSIRHQSHQSFLAGLDFYKARADKGYSLTDCISMATMRHEGIIEILTSDAHFVQEGFLNLL